MKAANSNFLRIPAGKFWMIVIRPLHGMFFILNATSRFIGPFMLVLTVFFFCYGGYRLESLQLNLAPTSSSNHDSTRSVLGEPCGNYLFESTSNSNATYERSLCNKIRTTGLAGDICIEPTNRMILPECFYNSTTWSITSIRFSNVIFPGNDTIADPLERLVSSFSSAITNITIQRSSFVTETFQPYGFRASWDAVWTRIPSVTSFGIIDCSTANPSLLPATGVPSSITELLFVNSGFVGPISSTLLANHGSTSPTNFRLELGKNSLNGTVPPMLLNFDSSNMVTLTLDLAGNQLTGTIPSNIAANLNWTGIRSLNLNFADNTFTGDFLSHLFPSPGPVAITQLSRVSIDVSGNSLMTGSLPTSFLDSLAFAQSPSISTPTMVFAMENTGLSGTLRIPDFSAMQTRYHIDILASGADLTSLSFLGSNPIKSLRVLDISNNQRLQSTLPGFLFNTSSVIRLLASNTNLQGHMPDMSTLTSSELTEIDLSFTEIEFCDAVSPPRNIWSPISSNFTCRLYSTSAQGCRALYPRCVTVAPPSVAPLSRPSSSPTATASPSYCPISSRPSVDFECVDGIWTYEGNFNSTTLTVPGPAIVVGNLTSSEIILTGFGSLTIKDGCATNLTSITIELTKEDLDRIGTKSRNQTLLTIDGGAGCRDLSSVKVITRVKDGGCKKLKLSTSSSSSSISALFTVDRSGCNTWWIILVAVVASIVVVGILTMVLLVVFVPSVRNCIRPFSAKRPANAHHVS